MSCAAPLLAPPQDLHRPGAGVPPGSRGPQPGHTPPGQYATSGTVPRAIGGTSLASVTRAASLGESEGRVLAQGMTALGLVRLYNPRGPTKASSKPIHFRAPAEPPSYGRRTELKGKDLRHHREALCRPKNRKLRKPSSVVRESSILTSEPHRPQLPHSSKRSELGCPMRRLAGARTLHHRPGEGLVSLGALDGLSAGWVLPGHGDAWTGGLPEARRLIRAARPKPAA